MTSGSGQACQHVPGPTPQVAAHVGSLVQVCALSRSIPTAFPAHVPVERVATALEFGAVPATVNVQMVEVVGISTSSSANEVV